MEIDSFETRYQNMASKTDGSLVLQEFHRLHKLTLLAHGQEPAKELGRIVAKPCENVYVRYETKFDELLQSGPPPRSKHVNVLQHMLGYLKRDLRKDDKEYLLERMETFRNGGLDLDVILRDFRQKFDQNPDPWIADQTYWRDAGIEPPRRRP